MAPHDSRSRRARKAAAAAAQQSKHGDDDIFSLIMNIAKFLTSLAVIAVAFLVQNAANHNAEDRIRCALGIIVFVASSWGFIALSLEAKKRSEAREVLASRRYQGVLKRFSEKNGWGLISVPGHRDARIYRAERDRLAVALGEAVDFRVEADVHNPGWFKAVDVVKINIAEVEAQLSDDGEEEDARASRRKIRGAEPAVAENVEFNSKPSPVAKEPSDLAEATTCSGDSDTQSLDASKEENEAMPQKNLVADITSEDQVPKCSSMSS